MGEDFYNEWISNLKMFFILTKNGWRNIKFNKKSNYELSGKDEYGNSLIALLVDLNGNLIKSTLRCNHIGIKGDADLQYPTYSELSNLTNFNVEQAIKRFLKIKKLFMEAPTNLIIPTNISEINVDTFNNIIKSNIKEIYIPNNITKLGYGAFKNCSNLININTPNEYIKNTIKSQI